MELSITCMYWLVKLDDIRGFLFSFGAISLVILILGSLLAMIYILGEEHTEYLKKYFITSAVIAVFTIIFFAASTFIPSTKQMAAIVVLPKIVNNQKVQELPYKILDLSTAWLEELKPNKKD